MPILPAEPDCYPPQLLEDVAQSAQSGDETSSQSDPDLDPEDADDPRWYLAYTKSRQEKALMRQLRQLDVPHYAPQIPRRFRSPSGRIRTSLVPLFANYVFVFGNKEHQQSVLGTKHIAKLTTITDGQQLVDDLLQIKSLISIDVPMTIEGRIGPGQRVRVRSGSFKGYEGLVDRRDAETRLIVAVQFMDQGVSVKLDDCQLEVI